MGANQAAAFALSKVGQGYIYGARGQTCSAAFRRQQANQYPDQGKYILDVGKKWDGVPVWDCAQLTRYAAKAAGVELPSGATSQWKKGPWKRKGEIGTLPQGEVLFLYRESGGKMQHTGLALGNGTCVHARGTAYGVVHQPVSGYAWTHWASPWEGPKMPEKEDKSEMSYTAKVIAESGHTVRMRSGPGKGYTPMLSVPVGMEVEVLAPGEEWSQIRVDGEDGFMMSQYLEKADGGTLPVDERLAALEKRVAALEKRQKGG